MNRMYIDCRDLPDEKNCTLRMSGTEEELVIAAARHAAEVHGQADNRALRTKLRARMKPLGRQASGLDRARAR
jgi:hypothetical protein